MDLRVTWGTRFVHEAVADVVVGGRVGGRLAGDVGFLQLPVAAVGEQVPRIARPHDAGAGERQGDAGGVDGDPAAAPLLGDVGGGAGATGRVEDEITGVGRHQDAALDDTSSCLYNVHLLVTKPRLPRVVPDIVVRLNIKVREWAYESQRFSDAM